ncbi:MAG TPA: aminotransferase class III-fold pyridoxal phosphate-dependent enzyme [Pseudolysinimonas sp.]|nr:aminotransferase class III-fold pyridoxal phosphate-dependent enzyme [Pseudolysinimonas sp.]
MAGPTSYFNPVDTDELPPRTADLVRRRAAALGSAYRLFYREPLELARGRGAHVWDRDGVEYLDVYNNVPSAGHAHPRIVAAIAEQAARLNTHTRYLDEATIVYAEDLLSTFPAHLQNVMFTCTGSEANDLALRIAKAATGGEGVIVTRNAYHGVTTEIAAISPSLGGVDSLAPWVRMIDAPTPGVDLGVQVVAALESLAAAGIRPAALIVDTIFASDGMLPDAAGLPAAVAAIRAAGGIFIADEVQPGFGRLGRSDPSGSLWGFARHALEPDLVSLGKPMGNGHPIAGVVARRELVDDFAARGRYFNTFGGNAVSIAAAQATLDVLREEGLPEHAAAVGGRLLAALGAIDDPRIGAVRGAGLFLGVDLIDAEGRPDEPLALDVVNALRARRILLAVSGPHNHSLKIRPPLVFDDADATRLVTELAAVLSERA